MHDRSQSNPQRTLHVFFFQAPGNSENQAERRQISRVQILVHDVKRGAGDRDSEQRRDQTNSGPSRPSIRKQNSTQLPACQQQQKSGRDMPDKDSRIERQVGNSQRERNDIGEKSQAGMRGKKLPAYRKQARVENLLHSGEIDFSIFCKRVISVNQQGAGGQQQQAGGSLIFLRLNCSPRFSVSTSRGVTIRALRLPRPTRMVRMILKYAFTQMPASRLYHLSCCVRSRVNPLAPPPRHGG